MIIDNSKLNSYYFRNFFRQFRMFVFDFDGVIVDSVKLKEKIYLHSFGVNNDEVKEQILIYVRSNTHMNREQKLKNIYNLLIEKFPDENFDENFFKKFNLLVNKHILNLKIDKDFKKFLSRLNNENIFILSAAPQNEVETILKRNNIFHIFIDIFASKTDKSLILNKLIKLYDSQKILFFGDKYSDYIAAKKTNVNFLGRLSEDNPTIFPDSCKTFKSFSDLCNYE